jgi:hypothetical protein
MCCVAKNKYQRALNFNPSSATKIGVDRSVQEVICCVTIHNAPVLARNRRLESRASRAGVS